MRFLTCACARVRSNENLPETHAVLKRMRAAMDASYNGRMFLAEANQWPEDVREYFGDGDECHMAYHFPLMPRIFMAVALEDRYPIAEIMRQTPDIPENCQWAIFLRNHDELTLEMVTDRERDYMYRMYAQEPRMRVNVGIRRRLAPLLNNDLDRIKLMNSLLLSMPGSPIIYYGDEIGMGDNIYIGDRNGVRTPMQWSIDRNAGFSRADPQRLYLPLIMDPIYGYQAVNVEAQEPRSVVAPQLDASHPERARAISLLRARCARFRASAEPQDHRVRAQLRSGDRAVRCESVADRAGGGTRSVEVQGARAGRTHGSQRLPADRRTAVLSHAARARLLLAVAERLRRPAFVACGAHAGDRIAGACIDRGSGDVVAGERAPDGREHRAPHPAASRTGSAARVPAAAQLVYATHGLAGFRTDLAHAVCGAASRKRILLSYVEARSGAGDELTYFLPLTIAWEDGDENVLRTAEWTLAKVREHARVGVLIDAFADPGFCIHIVNSRRRECDATVCRRRAAF